jgi:hypothetical protein
MYSLKIQVFIWIMSWRRYVEIWSYALDLYSRQVYYHQAFLIILMSTSLMYEFDVCKFYDSLLL